MNTMNTTTDDFDAQHEASVLAMAHRTDAARARADSRLRELRRQRAEGLTLDARDQMILARADGVAR